MVRGAQRGGRGQGDDRPDRMGEGNFSNIEGVGNGVFEHRIHFGPGYRIYFGKDGETLVVLLGGSTKKRQQQAIQAAHRS